jgi:hypothetical protein
MSRAEIKEAITGYVTDHHRFNIRSIEATILKLSKGRPAGIPLRIRDWH